VFNLRVETIIVAVLAICVFLSFYFSLLSLQTLDDTLKKQLVALATYTLITGVIMLTCLTITSVIKKIFPKMEAQQTSKTEKTEKTEPTEHKE